MAVNPAYSRRRRVLQDVSLESQLRETLIFGVGIYGGNMKGV
jgi:hypothetical protein